VVREADGGGGWWRAGRLVPGRPGAARRRRRNPIPSGQAQGAGALVVRCDEQSAAACRGGRGD
jgi:hypothetical protein